MGHDSFGCSFKTTKKAVPSKRDTPICLPSLAEVRLTGRKSPRCQAGREKAERALARNCRHIGVRVQITKLHAAGHTFWGKPLLACLRHKHWNAIVVWEHQSLTLCGFEPAWAGGDFAGL